jgi:hypothetical protein
MLAKTINHPKALGKRNSHQKRPNAIQTSLGRPKNHGIAEV